MAFNQPKMKETIVITSQKAYSFEIYRKIFVVNDANQYLERKFRFDLVINLYYKIMISYQVTVLQFSTNSSFTKSFFLYFMNFSSL